VNGVALTESEKRTNSQPAQGESMTSDDHAAIWAYESAACEPTAWERWINEVESLLGHGADGDQSTDGYSLDGFYEMWERGLTPAAAVSVH
jgi:hypothetical protein